MTDDPCETIFGSVPGGQRCLKFLAPNATMGPATPSMSLCAEKCVVEHPEVIARTAMRKNIFFVIFPTLLRARTD